jgi:hypothetical protein
VSCKKPRPLVGSSEPSKRAEADLGIVPARKPSGSWSIGTHRVMKGHLTITSTRAQPLRRRGAGPNCVQDRLDFPQAAKLPFRPAVDWDKFAGSVPGQAGRGLLSARPRPPGLRRALRRLTRSSKSHNVQQARGRPPRRACGQTPAATRRTSGGHVTASLGRLPRAHNSVGVIEVLLVISGAWRTPPRSWRLALLTGASGAGLSSGPSSYESLVGRLLWDPKRIAGSHS